MVVAIDGPAGAGKSTVARAARRQARLQLPGQRRDVPLRRAAGARASPDADALARLAQGGADIELGERVLLWTGAT